MNLFPTPPKSSIAVIPLKKCKLRRREQNRRARRAKRWRKRQQQLLPSPAAFAQPVAHRCHDCYRLQSECSSSASFKQGAVGCVECAAKHLDKANLAYSRLCTEIITKRRTQSTITDSTSEPTTSQSGDSGPQSVIFPPSPARLGSLGNLPVFAETLPATTDVHLPTTRPAALQPRQVPTYQRPRVATGPSVPHRAP